MSVPGILDALAPLVRAFEALGVSYYIGGSIASSAHGIARATLVERLHHDYYIDEDIVRGAVRHRSSFNMVHLESMLKLDVFVLKQQPYSRVSLARARIQALDESDSESCFFVASPEDVILQKLDWFRKGGGISERQWNDVLGVIKVQGCALDREYLLHWAAELGLSDMLHRAWEDARRSRP